MKNILKKYKYSFFLKKKTKVLEEIKNNNIFVEKYFEQPWAEDKDIINLIIKKFGNNILNKYPEELKKTDFFKSLLDNIEKDKKFLEIKIPDGIYQDFHIIQSILKEEKNNAYKFSILSPKYQKDPNLFALALKLDESLITYMIDEFLDNIEVGKTVVMIKPEMYSEFSLKVQKNEDFALTAFIRKADIFSLLSKDILDNEGFWIRLLWFKEEYIKFLPKKFKDNIVFEEKAITKYPSLINVFPNKKKDLIYMKDLIEKNVYMISCGTDEQKDNDILAERIMNNHPSCFRYLSNRLRGKREYALLAIKENGDNIEYCSTELKNDMFLAEKALEHSLLAFEYIGEDLKKNECFILRMLKKAQEKKIDISVICRNIDQDLLEKREILEMVMKSNVNYAKKVSKNTLLSYDVMHMIITNHPEAFDICSKKLELVNPFSNSISVSEQHSSAKIIDKMIKINPIVIKYIPRDYKNEDFYLRYKDTIESIKDELKDDYELNQLMRADHLFKQLSKEELDKENKQISIENDIINSQNPPVVIRRKKI